MGETRIVFTVVSLFLHSCITTRKGSRIYSSIRAVVDSLFVAKNSLVIFTNSQPLTPGIDFHMPGQKAYSQGVMLRECRGWISISREEIQKVMDDMRVELMESRLAGEIKRSTHGSKWSRLSSSLDWYEERLPTLYPTQADLDLDELGRKYGGGDVGRTG